MKIRIDENYRFSRFDYESSCIFTSRQSMIDCDQELSSLDSTVFIAEMLQPEMLIWNPTDSFDPSEASLAST